MTPMIVVWSQFFFCAALIGVAGVQLVRYGDAISELTGLSRSWIGMVLVATVTSLPELVTGVSAVTLADAPDLAAGDALGSCVFNLAILALVDIVHRREPLYAAASVRHAMTAALGVILLSGVGLAIVLSRQGALPSLGPVSLASPLLIAVYLAGMRALYLAEQRQRSLSVPHRIRATSLRRALMGYGLASAAILGLGIWLPLIGVELAQVMGWSNSFVGTLLVALATSVPELATTWGALRMGAIDMVFGNLLGSNLFDVLILALDDLAYRRGPLYADLSLLHAVSALTATAMSGAVIAALVVRPVVRVWRIASGASLILLVLYLLNAVLQYRHGR